MKITYTGSFSELLPKQRTKFETKLQKIAKSLERKGEREARVILSSQRHLSKVEITLNAFDHSMVGVGSDGDLVIAMNVALDKLEKQVVRMREKFREGKRSKDKEKLAEAAPVVREPAKPVKPKAAAPVQKPKRTGVPRVFPVAESDGHKPMTLEEAMVEMETSQDYMVYRDAKTDRLSILMRRPDGHFDLIES